MSKYIFVVLAILICNGAAIARADRKNTQSGEIVLAPDESVKVYTYEEQENDSLKLVQSLSASAEALASGGGSQFPAIANPQLEYLATLYLYCTINNGTCPEVLDTVLEADVINARISKEASCPIMKKFWKIWINSDMEKRQNYSIRTGHLNAADEFKRTERPKYIKCEDTVKAAIEGGTSDTAYFKDRYSGEKSKRTQIEKTAGLIAKVKEKKINILSSVGLR